MRHAHACILAFSFLPLPAAAAEIPAAIAVPGAVLVSTVQAVGAQVYECKNNVGDLVWQFREPVATLLVDGRTVGRHYNGPKWEMADGSAVTAKVAGRAPSAGANDIPQLRLDVTGRHGEGQLNGVTTILRINTRGGVAERRCTAPGAFLSVPYTADYAFYRKPL